MRRVYCYPIVLDLQLAVCKLDGATLTLERFRVNTIMEPNPEISKNLAGFEEVTIKEFLKLVEEQASEESVKAFTEYYESIYGRRE